MEKIKVGIIGSTGYAGVELFRILLRHPGVEKIFCSSVSFEGQQIDGVYQNLIGQMDGKCDGKLLTADEVKEKLQIIPVENVQDVLQLVSVKEVVTENM